jgi:hypothetical protein
MATQRHNVRNSMKRPQYGQITLELVLSGRRKNGWLYKPPFGDPFAIPLMLPILLNNNASKSCHLSSITHYLPLGFVGIFPEH